MRALGFDLGLKQHTWVLKSPSCLWIRTWQLDETPRPRPPAAIVVIEWPSAQGYERVYARLLELACALRDSLLQAWPGVPLYGVPSNVLRYKVCGWQPRRDGHADPFVLAWMRERPNLAEHLKRGGLLNSEDKRDACVAALWGQAVLAGKIEQPERWLLTTANCQLDTAL